MRREHQTQDISQDPDFSCLLFLSSSSGRCQCPHVDSFPVTSPNGVVGKLSGMTSLGVSYICALGSPRRNRQKATCYASLALHGSQCVLCSRRWWSPLWWGQMKGGMPKEAPKACSPWRPQEGAGHRQLP